MKTLLALSCLLSTFSALAAGLGDELSLPTDPVLETSERAQVGEFKSALLTLVKNAISYTRTAPETIGGGPIAALFGGPRTHEGADTARLMRILEVMFANEQLRMEALEIMEANIALALDTEVHTGRDGSRAKSLLITAMGNALLELRGSNISSEFFAKVAAMVGRLAAKYPDFYTASVNNLMTAMVYLECERTGQQLNAESPLRMELAKLVELKFPTHYEHYYEDFHFKNLLRNAISVSTMEQLLTDMKRLHVDHKLGKTLSSPELFTGIELTEKVRSALHRR